MAHTAVREEKAHRTVKHFLLASRQLTSARERFERQQRCLTKRAKNIAQIVLARYADDTHPEGAHPLRQTLEVWTPGS